MKSVLLGTATVLVLYGAAEARNRLDGDFIGRGEGGISLSVRAMGETYAVRLDSEKCGRTLEGFAKADSVISRSLQFEKRLEGQDGACYVQLGYDPRNDSYAIDAGNCERHVDKTCEFDGIVQRVEKRVRWRHHRRHYFSMPSPQPAQGPTVEATQRPAQDRSALFGPWPF